MTRQEHLDWCKKRALEYVDNGNLKDAVASMLSDLGKHDETKGAGESMALVGMFELVHGGPEGVRRFIVGFR